VILVIDASVLEGIEVETGSGNVFADLGLPAAEKLKIKPAADPVGHLTIAIG